MSEEDEDESLESFWKDLRPVGPRPVVEGLIVVNSGKVTDLDASLELACEKTTHELTQQFQHYSGAMLTTEMLVELVTTGVKVFMNSWREGLKSHDLAGLIELVLVGQNLPLDDLRGFVRALPSSLLERVARSAVGGASGLHGLMGIEHARRAGHLQEYTLGQDAGRLFAEFGHQGQEVRFFLDDEFELPEDEPAPLPAPEPAPEAVTAETVAEDSAQDGVVGAPNR